MAIRQQRTSFTLIHFLSGIAVLSILANGVLLLTLKTRREKTVIIAYTHLKQLGRVEQTYMNDHNTQPKDDAFPLPDIPNTME